MSRISTDSKFKKDIGKRLSSYMDHVGMTATNASELLGVSPDLIYKIKRGDGLIGLDRFALLGKIDKKFNVCNLHWLITGQGDMLIDANGIKQRLPNDLQGLPPEAIEAIGNLVKTLSSR